MKNGIVSLSKLPGELIYVEISKDLRYKILSHLKQLTQYQELRKLARELNIHHFTLYNLFNNKVFRLSVLFKPCKYLGYPVKLIEKEILTIKSGRRGVKIKNPKFPLNFRNREEQYPKNKSFDIYLKCLEELIKEGKEINRATLANIMV
ncbi:MAG: hypothetical protein QMD14_05195 [Candidatus Aenigmarchaeota archaeon]|nr:hypothetical protein [Candidatus Aenigmarchaeota archaeon]